MEENNMTVDEFIKKCDKYNYTFLLSNTIWWKLKIRHATYDGDYIWHEEGKPLEELLSNATLLIENRVLK